MAAQSTENTPRSDEQHEHGERVHPDIQQFLAGAGSTLFVGLLYLALPDDLSIGPRWLVLVIVAVLLAPSLIAALIWRRALPLRLARRLAQAQVVVATLALIGSLGLLVSSIVNFQQGRKLLVPAAILWSINVLVFTLWYWELDGGGPLGRTEEKNRAVDYQFIQERDGEPPNWKPGFVDYLYLAFNTATAFSPTDTMPLTPLAKLMMMAESIVSLVIVVLLVGRSVNIL
ncbi:MAG: hypothetical protein ACRDHP_06835 [Ktedonobacterales bacterium]